MKRIVLILLLILIASEAVAQRLQTPRLSCGQARQIITSRGAAVLGTGGYTYDRFVANLGFCLVGEYAEPAWVPTVDTPQCFVGYRCRQGPNEDFQ